MQLRMQKGGALQSDGDAEAALEEEKNLNKVESFGDLQGDNTEKKSTLGVQNLLAVQSNGSGTDPAETNTGEHKHCVYGESDCNKEGHNQITSATEIKQENGKLYKGGEEWKSTETNYDYVLEAGAYYLSTDITLNEKILIKSDVTLCLNGKDIITNANNHEVIGVYSGSLTLTDCKGGTSNYGKITHGKYTDNNNEKQYSGIGVYIYDNGTFNMYGGSITGNNAGSSNGGGVCVLSGSIFNMYGGSIAGNSAQKGGGVYVDGNSNFTMTGGEILENTATSNGEVYANGGGVYVMDGTFNMCGGRISENNAVHTNGVSNNGGGVFVGNQSNFIMSGGEISNNSTSNFGGGVYVSSNGNFTVSGDVKITDNVKGGTRDSETGKITGGSASNVYLREGKTITIGKDGLGSGAEIGVTTASTPTGVNPVTIATGATEDRSGCFTSDQSYYSVYDASRKEIRLEKNAPHIHYLCCEKTCNGVGGHSESDKTIFEAWSSMTELPRKAGYYYLTEDVELSKTWQINDTATTKVVLCLNGHTIQMKNDQNIVIYVYSGNNLTLTDCAPKGVVGKVTHGENKTGSGVGVEGNGTFTLYGGSISGNKTDTGNGGVLVYGTFTMCGGSISGNNAGSNGGGVAVMSGGQFTMSGGSITGNTAASGSGGVYVNDSSSKFTMYGGSISGNNTNGYYGGGVYVYDGTFKLQNGSITGNYVNGTLDSATDLYEKGDNGKDNNVYLRSGKTIDASELEANAGKIGVTTADTPAAGAPVAIATGAKDSVDYSEIFTPDVEDKDYTITRKNDKVYLTAHTHNWAYSVSSDGATITATCDGCKKSGSVTVNAPTALTYDGSDKAATVTKSDWLGENVTITYKQGDKVLTGTPKNVGTYTASIEVGEAKASVEYTIEQKIVKPAIEVAGGSEYNGGKEVTPAVTVKDGETVIPASEYSVAYSNNINAGSGTVTVTNKVGGNYIIDETSETFTIAQATYTGTNTAAANAVINTKGSTDVYVKLPELPDGASYGTVTLGNTTDKDGNPQTNIFASGYGAITDGKLHLRVESKTVGLTAHVKVAVTGATNYKNYEIDITVTTVAKKTARVSIDMDHPIVTYGDTITMKAKAEDENGKELTGGTWTWEYNGQNNLDRYFDLVESNGNTLKLKVIKAHRGDIDVATAIYENDGYEGKFTFPIGNIARKELTQNDLEGIPSKLTKEYDGSTGYTYTDGTAIALTLKESAYVTDSDRNMQIGISANQITFAQKNVGNTTATISLTEASEILARMNDNYKFASGFTSIEVPAEITKADPSYTIPTGLTATYGQTLSDVTLPSGWSWCNATESVGDATENSATLFEAVFTPNDTDNYNTVKKDVAVKVNKASGKDFGTIKLEQRDTDTNVHTQPLDWTQLPKDQNWSFNGVVSRVIVKNDLAVDGAELTYKVADGTIDEKIIFTIRASCDNYEDYTYTIELHIVARSTQTGFKFAETTKTVTYGDGEFTMVATGQVTGSNITYESSNTAVATVDNTGKVTIVGAGTTTITATASATDDYNVATATYTLTVNKKQITAPTEGSTEFTYNGKEQTYALAENDAYIITGNKQTNANENGYAVTVSLKDKINTKWAGEDDDTADKTYRFIIKKATITIAAKNQTEYVGKTAPVLGEDSYTVSGLFGDDQLTTKPTIKYVDATGNEVTPDMTKTGETIISVSGAVASENYTISYTNGKLTVSAAPSGGSSIQRPTIIADTGADAKLNYNGRTLTIAAEEGYEITDVLVNGISKGKVTEITGLKTGDKVEVKAAKKAEPTDPAADKNAKLIKGVGNTTIILKSKLTKAGKVLLTWTKSKGYKVDYFEVYRSVKKNSGYGKKPFFTTKDGSWSKYLNTKELKAGKTYYYKIRGVRVIDSKKYYTKYSNKAWRTMK